MGNQQATPDGTIHPSKPQSMPQKIKQSPNKKINQLPPLKVPNTESQKLKQNPHQHKTPQTNKGVSVPPLQNSRVRRMSSNDIPVLLQKNNTEGFLSLQEINDLFLISQSKLQTFFDNLQEPLSRFYMEITKDALTYMNKKYFLSVKDAQLFLADRILTVNLNIMKVLGRKSSHEFNEDIFKKFNDLQKALIGYIKAKYPRSAQNFVPGDLMNIFKSFDYVQSPQNDIIRQAGFYFGKQYARDLLKMIKEFLNKLIDEVDMNFPRFQKMFQDKVFNLKGSQDKSVRYKIDRKLPENASKFTNVNSNSLDIVSPQLFRVILRWVNDMEDFILHAQDEVHQKQTFKVINEEDAQTYYVDQISVDDNKDLLKQLIQKLDQEKQNFVEDLQGLIKSMYKFQHNMIKIIEQGQLVERYVPVQDAEIIKFAAYNTKFMSWMLTQKLTVVLKKLIKVGRHFKNTVHMVPLDLVKFNVTDMLRAMILGTKTQILQVYNNLKNLEIQEEIEIIKMENRLMTPQNDILIIFKMKGSFLICELQLILTESNQNSNQKYKNIQTLNELFSSLQHSPYGVISQLAEIVGYQDSKVLYEGKVNFKNKQVGIPRCQLRHPNSINTVRQQFEPFICTSCSKYYGRLENIFVMKYCQLCNNFLCSKCIFDKDTSLEPILLKEEIIKHLNEQSNKYAKGKSQGNAANISGNTIYDKSFKKVIQVKQIKKELKVKKITKTQFQAYIQPLGVQNFVYGSFQKAQIKLYSLSKDFLRNQIVFGFQSTDDFYTSKIINFKDNDFLILFDALNFAESQSTALQKQPCINIFEGEKKFKKGKYKLYKIQQTNILIGFRSQKQQINITVDGVSVSDNQMLNKKQFKFANLKKYFQYQGTSQRVLTFMRIQDLGLENIHLKYFKQLKWSSQVMEINISKNKITDIDQIFGNFPNLQRLSASENFIQQIDLKSKLEKLNSLILKNNTIKRILHLQNSPNLQRLNMHQNRLQQFPILKLLNLRNLQLSRNYDLQKIDFIQKSNLPELAYLNLEYSGQNIHFQLEQSQRHIIISFPKLKCFLIDSLKVNKITFHSQCLERLHLLDCKLSEIIGKFPRLEYLNASRNKISSMENMFANYQNNVIVQIDLSDNQIASLPLYLRSNTLKRLDLNSNKLKKVDLLGSYVFQKLEYLNISQNQVQTIPFVCFSSLRQFYFYGNPITNINDFCLSILPQMNMLDFQNITGLKTLPSFNFNNFGNLKILKLPRLQDCDIKQFQRSNLPCLTNLRIQNCKLKQFPEINFPNLQELDIGQTKIQDMQALAKVKLQNLKNFYILYANQNQYNQEGQVIPLDMTRFMIDLPKSLDKLEFFTVNYSRFSNTEKIFEKSYQNLQVLQCLNSQIQFVPRLNMPKLKTINVQGNKIKDVKEFFLSDLPCIEDIDLSNNIITSIDHLKYKTLKSLNLGTNQLVQFKNIDLTNLASLDISNNLLAQFPVIWSQKLTTITFHSNQFRNVQNLEKCFLPSLENLQFSSIELQPGKLNFPKLQMPKLQNLIISQTNFDTLQNINLLKKLSSLKITYCKSTKQLPVLWLPELKDIEIQNCSFESWTGLQTSTLPSLACLSISFSNLNQLKGPICPNLKNFMIYNNQSLVSVECFFAVNTFADFQMISMRQNPRLQIKNEINISSLKKLDITSSKLSSSKMIGSSDQLNCLVIAGCQFSELDLRQFKKMETMEIMNCKIQNIESFLKRQWMHLRTLYLNQNKIQNVYPMKDFPQLQNLFLDNNLIQNISPIAENSNFPNLLVLSVVSNKITQVNSLKNFPKLVILYLEGNLIEDISFLNRFQNVYLNISNINLSKNKIKSVPQLKSNAQYLYLSGNKIQSMDFVEKSEMPRIVEINLQNNQIKKLKPVTKLLKLQNLLLNGNPVSQFEDFLMKQKFPGSFYLFGSSVKATQQSIDEIMVRFTERNKQISVQLSPYVQENVQNQTH